MRSLTLSVGVLVSLVDIWSSTRVDDLIVIPQVLSPASVVFSGIGILLTVSIVLDLSATVIMILALVRRLRM